jgi:anti-sigma-K factor RskA
MGGHITPEQADEYAIGALEPEMERLVTLHCAECVSCREIVFESERVAANLAMTVPLRPAPRHLKKKVRVRAGIDRPGLLHYAVRFGQAAAVFAAVAIAVAALTGMVSMRGQVNELRQANDQLDRQIRDVASQEVEIFALSVRLAEAERRAADLEALAETDRELLAAMLSPDSDVAEVVTLPQGRGSIGRLVWEEDQNRLWFVARKLPPLEEGQTYQLWVDTGEETISFGTFRPDESGTATHVRYVPNGISNYVTAIVTLETSGASMERSGDAIFWVRNFSRLGN